MFEFEEDLGFAKISRSKKIDSYLIKTFTNAYSLNYKVFGKHTSKFNIYVCDTEKEIKKLTKVFSKWATATIEKQGLLVTRSPEWIEKIGRWKKSDFQNLMNHEINHIFWYDIINASKPIWLCEGIACYVGNNFIINKEQLSDLIKKYKITKPILDYRYLRRNFKKGHFPRYPLWANLTKFIVTKYSLNKIKSLIQAYAKNKDKDHYNKAFNKIFKKTQEEIFNEFLESVKK